MFTVELYARIRRAVMADGLSRRDAAKQFGVHRNTISKMLQFSIPPGYRRRERPVSKKLGPHMAWIDAILGQCRTARVHSGASIDGELPSASGRTSRLGSLAAGRHQLRCGEDAAACQIGEPARPSVKGGDKMCRMAA